MLSPEHSFIYMTIECICKIIFILTFFGFVIRTML